MQAASLLGGLLGPAVGGVLADTIGIRAPFTFTGTAAALAALYGLIRLPETQLKRQESMQEAPQEADVGNAIVRNNAVPATLASSSIKLQVPEEALIAGKAMQQGPQQEEADHVRRTSHTAVSLLSDNASLPVWL